MPFLKINTSYSQKVIHFFEKNNDIFIQIRDAHYNKFVINLIICTLTKIDNPFLFVKGFKDKDMMKLLTHCIVEEATLDVKGNEWYLQLINTSRAQLITMLEHLNVIIEDAIKNKETVRV